MFVSVSSVIIRFCEWVQVGSSGGVWLCSITLEVLLGAGGPVGLQPSDGLPGHRLAGGGTAGPAVFFCVSVTDVLFWFHFFSTS